MYLANSYFYNYKASPHILHQHCVERNLRKNKYIVITNPDKGNGVVILDQKLYNNTIDEFFSDTSKFEKLFNEIEYKFYSYGSAPACIYGIPKIHKLSSSDSFPRVHLIVSSIGNFNYNLARFLCDLLSLLVANDYSCKYTFSFVSQIKNANLSKKSLVSYDARSLFTNIPLQKPLTWQ